MFFSSFFSGRCSYPSHHRLFSLFYFQAVLTPFTPPPIFAFLFSGGAHTFLTTAYFRFSIFRRCSYPSHHRLLSLFYFQAVLTPFTSPPTFAFLFSGGAHAPHTPSSSRFTQHSPSSSKECMKIVPKISDEIPLKLSQTNSSKKGQSHPATTLSQRTQT